MIEKQKVIVICGPTASGKTALSIELAKKVNGEIVSADSMQIYQQMDIGTAKPTIEEKQGIPHYVMDYVCPTKRYSVAEYKKDAMDAIETILKKGKVPIVVGGTGLYINSLIEGIDYIETQTDLEYRQYLEEKVEKEGLEPLYYEACKIDEHAMTAISMNDQKRILRVLEIYHTTGRTKTQLEEESKKNGITYDYHTYGISFDREKLYERIDQRVILMIQHGLIEEVEKLCKEYGENLPTAMQGIGYKEVVAYLNGDSTKEEMIKNIQQESRRYAKRQMTWFRRNKDIIWINGQDKIEDNIQIILEESFGETGEKASISK